MGYLETSRLDLEQKIHKWREFSHVTKRTEKTEIFFYGEHIIMTKVGGNLVSGSADTVSL